MPYLEVILRSCEVTKFLVHSRNAINMFWLPSQWQRLFIHGDKFVDQRALTYTNIITLAHYHAWTLMPLQFVYDVCCKVLSNIACLDAILSFHTKRVSLVRISLSSGTFNRTYSWNDTWYGVSSCGLLFPLSIKDGVLHGYLFPYTTDMDLEISFI